MKTISTLAITLIAGNIFGQVSTFNKLIIDSKRHYEIHKLNQTYPSCYVRVAELENEMIETTDMLDTVTADLIVNFDPQQRDEEQIYINSSKATLKGDTLVIDLYHHGFDIIWDYEIVIVHGRYQVTTWFTPPIDSNIIKVNPLTTLVKLSTSEFKKGEEIKGYTKLIEECEGGTGCFAKGISIEGDFRVTVE